MQTDVKQVFYFHATAHSLGGFLENPPRHIPTPSSVSLSTAGGSSTNETGEFHFEDRIHAKSCYTHSSGIHTKRNGPWTQLVTGVVEGFDLFGRVTADRLIAQIAIEHPEGRGHRRISFAGSRIDNLCVDGKPVTPVYNPTFMPPQDRNVPAYNKNSTFTPDLEWPILWKTAYRQTADLLAQPNFPQWARERFAWIAAGKDTGEPNSEGYSIFSLVDKIEGVDPLQTFGNCIEIPDLGRIFLGQVCVFRHSVNLTMIRAELGCLDSGFVDAGSGGINGTTVPPS